MKKALIILYNNLIADGFEPNYFTGELRRGDEVIGFTANVHDEFQMEVPEHLAEYIGNLASDAIRGAGEARSEEHTSELQSLMRISYAVFCLTKKKTHRHM